MRLKALRAVIFDAITPEDAEEDAKEHVENKVR